MSSRSARSPRRRPVDDFDDEEGGVAAFLSRHRLLVGGLTAFTVAFSYVAANALWYQPHAHGGALFATRPPSAVTAAPENAAAEPGAVETVIRLEREEPSAPQPSPASVAPPAAARMPDVASLPAEPSTETAAPVRRGDPVVEEVQRILAGLNLYEGDIDGLTGPQTRGAIESYRKMVGLSVSTDIDDQLLTQLGARSRAAASAPPLPVGSPGTDMIETSSAVPRADRMVMRIQAGLKAFGNDGIEIDGVVGSRTRAAILEFQSLFGLPETGQPDEALYAKMREIGLTD